MKIVVSDQANIHSRAIPIGSMYGIYANIWGILVVNVTIYSSTMDPMGYMNITKYFEGYYLHLNSNTGSLGFRLHPWAWSAPPATWWSEAWLRSACCTPNIFRYTARVLFFRIVIVF